MPQFKSSLVHPRPLAEVFDFYIRPANLIRVSPPQLHMRLVSGPEIAHQGARVVLKGRRWCIPQRIVSEITLFEPGVRFVDEQRAGPLAKWVHTHGFATVPQGTRVTDDIEFEPPRGLLGLLLSERMLLRDLQWIFDYRMRKLAELLGSV